MQHFTDRTYSISRVGTVCVCYLITRNIREVVYMQYLNRGRIDQFQAVERRPAFVKMIIIQQNPRFRMTRFDSYKHYVGEFIQVCRKPPQFKIRNYTALVAQLKNGT